MCRRHRKWHSIFPHSNYSNQGKGSKFESSTASQFISQLVISSQLFISHGWPFSLWCKVYATKNPEMTALKSLLQEVDPSMIGRPLRDGPWIRAQWKDLTSMMTNILNKFNASGNQDASNIYDEWFNFLNQSQLNGLAKPHYYFILVMPIHEMNTYSRNQPFQLLLSLMQDWLSTISKTTNSWLSKMSLISDLMPIKYVPVLFWANHWMK